MKKFLLFFIVLILSAAYAQNKNDFTTKFEKSNYLETSRYDETIEYFKKLETNSKYAKLIEFGITPQGRKLYVLVISKDRAFSPEEAVKTGKAIVFIENGIHSGEIEGKDASMLLCREILITKEKDNFLDNAIILVNPVFNVDGHERFKKYNRINQNGPMEMGWRTNALNLNLNRDWMKADSPETQAMIKLINQWRPDFFMDNHTTDGADFQYTFTYGLEKYANLEQGLRNLVNNSFIPFMVNRMQESGYGAAPYIWLRNDSLEAGLTEWGSSPRLSTGYLAALNRIGLLVETHMLKPYKDRVFATKRMIEVVLEFVNRNSKKLMELDKLADENSIKELTNGKYLPIGFITTKNRKTYDWKGIKFKTELSEISGANKIVYTGEKYTITVPYYNDVVVSDSIKAPKGYLIPHQFSDVVERLKIHNIKVDELQKDKSYKVMKFAIKDFKFSRAPYEGRFRVEYKLDTIFTEVTVPAGTYFVDVKQKNIKVLMQLLDPKSGDSFMQWGFFNNFLEQKEYFEDYVMEKVALQMLNDNPNLKEEFKSKLKTDEAFRNNPHERLNFFYQRSPYWDEQFRIYPIMSVIE